MCTYIQVGSLSIPGYGAMIVIGIVLANLIACYLLHRFQMNGNDFLVLEGYIFLGAILGAKALYLFVSRELIDWTRFFDVEYFNSLMRGGFVFYGGVIFGFLAMVFGAKLHCISYIEYVQRFVWLIPFIHAFGRLGCFMAGCCYGREYDGVFSVVFPEESMAPSGVSLFPVQIVEGICLFMISFIMCLMCNKKASWCSLRCYLIGYGIVRFVLEYVRADADRGFWGMFSTSQWISVFLTLGCLIWILLERKRSKVVIVR